jgi:hypothetical protein
MLALLHERQADQAQRLLQLLRAVQRRLPIGEQLDPAILGLQEHDAHVRLPYIDSD